jgi:hypothetical protein
MVPVSVSGTASGGCGALSSKIILVTSSQPLDPEGDWAITGDLTLTLLADRLGTDKNGRVYTITVQSSDGYSDTATQTTTVLVPHDKGH